MKAVIAEKSQSRGSSTSRAVAGLFGALFAAYAIWYIAKLFGGVGISKNWVVLPIPLFALAISALLLLFSTLAGSTDGKRRLKAALVGGVIVGGAAFLVGFVGEIVFMPDANQGPLIGIVVTGPLGFILGSIAGAFVPTRTQRPVTGRLEQ